MKGTKRLATAITAIFTAGALTLGAAAAASHNYKGDINRDDKITSTAVEALRDHLIGKGNIAQKNRIYADVNEDGVINVVDLIVMKRMIASNAAPEDIKTTPAVTTTAVTTKAVTTTTQTVTTTTAKSTTATQAATTTEKATTVTEAATTTTEKATTVTEAATTTTEKETTVTEAATTTTEK